LSTAASGEEDTVICGLACILGLSGLTKKDYQITPKLIPKSSAAVTHHPFGVATVEMGRLDQLGQTAEGVERALTGGENKMHRKCVLWIFRCQSL